MTKIEILKHRRDELQKEMNTHINVYYNSKNSNEAACAEQNIKIVRQQIHDVDNLLLKCAD